MKSTILSGWATDFDTSFMGVHELETVPKDDFERFLQYALNQNPGVIALTACICGLDIYTSLQMFCGIRSNLHNRFRNPKSKTGYLLIDTERFKSECRNQGFSQRKIAALTGCSRSSIQDIFRPGKTVRKSKAFIRIAEHVLSLESGSLVLRKEQS